MLDLDCVELCMYLVIVVGVLKSIVDVIGFVLYVIVVVNGGFFDE